MGKWCSNYSSSNLLLENISSKTGGSDGCRDYCLTTYPIEIDAWNSYTTPTSTTGTCRCFKAGCTLSNSSAYFYQITGSGGNSCISA